MKGKFHFECTDCGATYDTGDILYLCPVCERVNVTDQPLKGILKTVYDFVSIRRRYGTGNLFEKLSEESFLPILPINQPESLPWLKIGNTPLYHVDPDIFGEGGCRFNLFLKDDSQNPTFSFKDRASALVSAWAKEHRIGLIVTASTGNAGSSLAGICAAQGQKAVIIVPADAPEAKMIQILCYGAALIPVEGTYDEAFDLSLELSRKFGWYNRNTAFNPLTLEGKKTVAWELYEQLGKRIPDRVFVPVGDGVILSGVAKGFEDLMQLGITDRMPVLVAVQSEEGAGLIRNLENDRFITEPSRTFADSIRVDIPRNFYMARKFIQQYQGECILVADEEIKKASAVLSRKTGIFTEPAAAASFAGLLKYRLKGLLPEQSNNVVLLTGSGLKDIRSIKSGFPIPTPLPPESAIIERYVNRMAL